MQELRQNGASHKQRSARCSARSRSNAVATSESAILVAVSGRRRALALLRCRSSVMPVTECLDGVASLT